jgi:hypothetical protein
MLNLSLSPSSSSTSSSSYMQPSVSTPTSPLANKQLDNTSWQASPVQKEWKQSTPIPSLMGKYFRKESQYSDANKLFLIRPTVQMYFCYYSYGLYNSSLSYLSNLLYYTQFQSSFEYTIIIFFLVRLHHYDYHLSYYIYIFFLFIRKETIYSYLYSYF